MGKSSQVFFVFFGILVTSNTHKSRISPHTNDILLKIGDTSSTRFKHSGHLTIWVCFYSLFFALKISFSNGILAH